MRYTLATFSFAISAAEAAVPLLPTVSLPILNNLPPINTLLPVLNGPLSAVNSLLSPVNSLLNPVNPIMPPANSLLPPPPLSGTGGSGGISANGFLSIADSISVAASNISDQAGLIATANAQLSGNLTLSTTPNLLPDLDIISATYNATNSLWQLATELEKSVCNIATSINQQNLAATQGKLVIALSAQVQAIIKIKNNLAITIAAIEKQLNAFTDAEKAVITAAIDALANAAIASVAPIATLIGSLSGTVGSSLATTLADLQDAITVLVNLSGSISFVPASTH